MLFTYLIQSFAFLFRQVNMTSCTQSEQSSPRDPFARLSIIPSDYLDNLRAIAMNIDLLYKQTEDRLGLYLKICHLFTQI